MSYVGRFAPSPTGPLHFGSLVAAVASWLDARAAGGRWHLRIEDVDVTRTVPGAEREILALLDALGLHWDGPVIRQSERVACYEAALATLRSRGFTYRCRCSRREIADSGTLGIDGVIYPGSCRDAHVDDSEPAAQRFRVDRGRIAIPDRLQGEIAQDLAVEIGDFVVKRRDGLFAYQLAVVVDDAELGVTDIVRGADLIDSTPRQVALQRALGLPTPRYLHLPVVTAGGEKLSKQTRAPAITVASGPAAISEALRFLGQDAPGLDQPAAMLARAAGRWNPGSVPRVRARDYREGTKP